MAKEDRAPAADERAAKAQAAEERQAKAQAAQLDYNQAAFYAQVAARTGWDADEAETKVKRLREKGDFFDERGRWTLDTAGWPVCLEGWKPEPIEPPAAP